LLTPTARAAAVVVVDTGGAAVVMTDMALLMGDADGYGGVT
jgi:hypothetical protein